MALEVKKQTKETTQGLLRRFTKKVQLSGVLPLARKRRFRTRNKSRQMKKRAALRKEKIRAEYKKLSKMGRLKTNR